MTDTLLHRLFAWSSEAPDAHAQMWKKDGVWTPVSAGLFAGNVEALARFLMREGFQPGDVGLIFAYNSPAYVQFDLALMLARGSSAGIYVNASAHHIGYIIGHAEAKFLMVDRLEDARRVFEGADPRARFPSLKRIIVNQAEGNLPEWAISFNEAVRIGKELSSSSREERSSSPSREELLSSLREDDRAVLIYTSGTTGLPKGVCLSHDNLIFAAKSYSSTWTPPKTGRMFSFLPLAHIAERMANIGIGLTRRYTVYFCSSPLAIASELKEVQPTICLCVPRLWDKLREGVEMKLKAAPEKKRKIAVWAMRVGSERTRRKVEGGFVSPFLALRYRIADKLVLSKIREQLGLKHAARTVSGAAALSPDTLEWYRGIGVNLIEAYALSETTGCLTCGMHDTNTSYTVGVPYPGIEIRLGSDGEIETRGRHVFQGYFKDEKSTAEMLSDGWLRTGDIGKFDENGNLRIAGRKREIIKNAEGKMISPLFIEAKLQAHSLIDQAIVIGNERPHMVALLTLPEGVTASAAVTQEVRDFVNGMNRDLASHERVKNFRILPRVFSIESDEMTATMKLKRHVIEKRYEDTVREMYENHRNAEI